MSLLRVISPDEIDNINPQASGIRIAITTKFEEPKT
jgi:hypothetical protein